MNPTIATAVAVLCLAFGTEAIFFGGVGVAGTAGTITLASGSGVAAGAALVGGAVLLKALALGALYVASRNRGGSSRRRYRGRRDAGEEVEVDEDDLAFSYISQTEPEMCYRRLICDMATGYMPKSENDIILSLFNKDTPITSPKYEYAMAAYIGKQVKNIKTCELRYSCALSGEQIEKLFQ